MLSNQNNVEVTEQNNSIIVLKEVVDMWLGWMCVCFILGQILCTHNQRERRRLSIFVWMCGCVAGCVLGFVSLHVRDTHVETHPHCIQLLITSLLLYIHPPTSNSYTHNTHIHKKSSTIMMTRRKAALSLLVLLAALWTSTTQVS